MTAPRENISTGVGFLAPLLPWFARKVAPQGAAQVKYDGDEDAYNDTSVPTATTANGVTLTADLPLAVRRLRLRLEDTVVTVVEAGDLDYGGTKICDLPDRNLLILNAEFVGTITFGGDIADGDDGDWSIGTAVASAQTLATTMANIIASQALDNVDVDADLAVTASLQAATGTDSTLAVADGASNALYVNAAIDDSQLAADGTLTFNGILDLWVIDLGNEGS